MRGSIENELSAHTGALRALARSLVGTQDAADLVQDVAVEALDAKCDRPRWLRAWLARVLRNLATKHRRAARRRRAHEGHAAELAASPSPSPSSSPGRVAAHREAVQRLTAALMTLPEPYQGTLLLRYFEDLSPRAIAARRRCRWRR